MWNRVLLLVGLGLASGAAIAEDNWRVFTRAESFSYSGANPVTAYIDFLIGPPPANGELAFSRNLIETGMGYKNVEFSLIHRNDYNLFFTQDAAEFAYLNKNRKTIPLDQIYDVDVWANQYQVTGAKLGFLLPIGKNLDITFAYSHLYAHEAVSGYLGADKNGEGGYISVAEEMDGDRKVRVLKGDLHADYFYVDDPLFESDVKGPTGNGYAVDFGFVWRVSRNLRMEGKIHDIAGEIRWENMPHIVADATSQNFEQGDDGAFNVVPNFSGYDTLDDFTQDLTRRDTLKLDYTLHRFVLGYRYERMSQTMFNWLSAGYRWGERWGVQLAGEVDTSAVELRLKMPAGELFFITDDLNLDYAHALGFGWNLHYRF